MDSLITESATKIWIRFYIYKHFREKNRKIFVRAFSSVRPGVQRFGENRSNRSSFVHRSFVPFVHRSASYTHTHTHLRAHAPVYVPILKSPAELQRITRTERDYIRQSETAGNGLQKIFKKSLQRYCVYKILYLPLQQKEEIKQLLKHF